MAVLSELRPRTMLHYLGEIIYKEDVERLAREDLLTADVYVVTDEAIGHVLTQAYDDYKAGIDREEYPLLNCNEVVTIDI